jgi:short-subunit dehydrogenase
MENAIREKVFITGASSGLGREIALVLSKQKVFDFVLSGRNQKALASLAAQLQQFDPECKALTIVGDLLEEKTLQEIEGSTTPIDIFINNAAVGVSGSFFDRSWVDHEKSIELNTVVTTRLLYNFGRAMKQRGSGIIVNVASLNAFFPTPYFASYSASKSFLLSLGEAVGEELAPFGVKVVTVCPGGMKTNFHLAAGLSDGIITKYGRMISSPRDVAVEVVRSLNLGRPVYIPGLMNRISLMLSKVIPRRILVAQAGAMYKEFSQNAEN